MKWPSWMRGLVLLRSLVRSLDRIEVQLRRIADVQEGIEPPARVLPPTTEPVVKFPDQSDAFFAEVESITERLRGHLGHDPTAEQVAHELDQLEYTNAQRDDATNEKLGL